MTPLRPRRYATSLLTIAVLFLAGPGMAQQIVLDQGTEVGDPTSGWLPFGFATDSLGTGVGAAAFSAGNLQPQTSLTIGGFATSNSSYAAGGVFSDYLIPNTGRLFLDSYLWLGHFTDERFYVDLDRNGSQPKAGSNDSDEGDFVEGESNNVIAELTLKYPLPIGSARAEPISVVRLDQGMLESAPQGGEVWNPLVSGKTTLSMKAFFRYRDLDNVGFRRRLSVNSNGLEFKLDYNNTDFTRNPSAGSRQKLTLTRDFGLFDSSNSWTNVELELTKYFNLGTSDWFKQQVLAMNFWTSSTPSWEADKGNSQIVSHRPPPNMGSYLGGYDRMRAYPLGRFQDKAAVYYSAELRLMPRLPSLRNIPLLEYFEIDWLQLATFVEAGRVSADYDTDMFTKDLKYDAGVGLRLMAFRYVFRVDYTVSDEGGSVWAMVNQTFGR
jgi:hypothetical protein